MSELPEKDAPQEAVGAWIDRMLGAGESAPGWRQRARGSDLASLVAEVDPVKRIDFSIPVSEYRVIRRVCRMSGESMRQFLRRAVAERLILYDVAEDEIPSLVGSPWRPK